MGSKANSNVLFLSCSASFVYDPAMKMSLKRRRLKKFLKTCLRWMTQPIFIHRNIIFFSLQYASKIMFKKFHNFLLTECKRETLPLGPPFTVYSVCHLNSDILAEAHCRGLQKVILLCLQTHESFRRF